MEPVDEINTALTINEFQTLLAGAREQGVIDPSEHELLTGALSLRSQSIGSIMIPARPARLGITPGQRRHYRADNSLDWPHPNTS